MLFDRFTAIKQSHKTDRNHIRISFKLTEREESLELAWRSQKVVELDANIHTLL